MAQTRQLVVRWGHLHAGRSALGVAATLVFLWALCAVTERRPKSCSSGAAPPASSRSTGRRRSTPSRSAWCARCTRQLEEWADDPAVTRVVLTAAGGRAFSAGGDIRALYELGRAGRHDEMLAF